MRFTGGAAFSAWDPTGDAAARIEQLELRLELEKTRNTIKELSAMLADYQQDNQRLKQRIYTVTGKRPAPPEGQRPPAMPAAHGVAAAAAADTPSPLLQSLIAAADLQVHKCPMSQPSYVSSLHEQQVDVRVQQPRFAASGARDPVVVVGNKSLRTSCDFCTRSKIRCDGRKPKCGNCEARKRCCHYSEKRRPGPKASRCSEAVSPPASQRRRLSTNEAVGPSGRTVAKTQAPQTTTHNDSMGGLSSLLLASSLTRSPRHPHPRKHTGAHTHTDATRGAAAMAVPASNPWSISFDHAQVESATRQSPLRATERSSFRF